MPVKLTSDGKDLEQTLQQAAPAPQQPKDAVDALLETADQIPAAASPTQNQQVVAQAEVGIVGKDGQITVETTEHLHVWLNAPLNYAGPYGKVTYGMGATINTGNFENLRPFVQIEVPFIPGQQDEAYAYAESWADARISSIINNSKAQISGA